ncbi:hypothetical protein E6W39_24205 [Kitasatospora acidiphila]|uniref:Uncharacterized protein n=1 Tax=Kitasatospora acidiphila TaxID=2567942 RepID=A0A540W6W4_9ACTN|nr:hypothetical protein [Kitasatospora acidiphila]TQF04760.1 hypothetical protein E6W39_24205 [Kitasatospora acidiphila]
MLDPYPQRNPGDSPVDVPAIPANVQPGEVVLWHLPIAGFEPVTDTPSPAPAAAADTPPDAPAKTTRARAASEE